jgi:hypothetical protein
VQGRAELLRGTVLKSYNWPQKLVPHLRLGAIRRVGSRFAVKLMRGWTPAQLTKRALIGGDSAP